MKSCSAFQQRQGHSSIEQRSSSLRTESLINQLIPIKNHHFKSLTTLKSNLKKQAYRMSYKQ